ncbi:hypothetical protein ARALYDRAFT_920384 [Arabidopsis lyrata subsp. lyrata]|uniref:F-box domain-containing protein n=1 Tax=Arabidopsis lyrata subsp. lyrata TaxID=81972 RepID=D7MWZ0_ARALL|nr:hypothetical protein ARALYDRAFT_920384 [Arabidopsis lyrata subsp. lyrata]
MENPNFDTLPEHLQMEILSRLPMISLVTCAWLCVSKKLASLIRSQEFKALYLSRWTDLDEDTFDLVYQKKICWLHD